MYEINNFEKCFCDKKHPAPPKPPKKEEICVKVIICAKIAKCPRKPEPRKFDDWKDFDKREDYGDGYSDFSKTYDGEKDYEFAEGSDEFKTIFDGKKDFWDLFQALKAFITVKAEIEKNDKKPPNKQYDGYEDAE